MKVPCAICTAITRNATSGTFCHSESRDRSGLPRFPKSHERPAARKYSDFTFFFFPRSSGHRSIQRPTSSGERLIRVRCGSRASVRARTNMNHGAVKWYRMEQGLSRCIAGSPIYGPAAIKTSGSCRKLLKWHSARALAVSGPGR